MDKRCRLAATLFMIVMLLMPVIPASKAEDENTATFTSRWLSVFDYSEEDYYRTDAARTLFSATMTLELIAAEDNLGFFDMFMDSYANPTVFVAIREDTIMAYYFFPEVQTLFAVFYSTDMDYGMINRLEDIDSAPDVFMVYAYVSGLFEKYEKIDSKSYQSELMASFEALTGN